MSSGSLDIFDEDNNQGPSNVVPRDPAPEEMGELYDFLADEMNFITTALDQEKLDTFSPTGEWNWELFQIDHLEHAGWWIGNKTRQAGISTSFAAKAFSRGILAPGNYTGVFVSYKRDEAQNKVNYVRQFLEALPPTFEKDIVRDPLQLIEWENHNGTRSKVVSHSQNPVRGLNGDVFLDELAFYQDADKIFQSAMPAVAGARAAMEITSTPFGKGDKFHEIYTDEESYPQFHREMIFWWECQRYLDVPSDYDPIEYQAKAEMEALDMELEERVREFGNEWLIMQYQNANTDQDFKQEFEGYFVDEKASFIEKDLIKSCMYQTSTSADYYDFKENDFNEMIDREDEALEEVKAPVVRQYPQVNFHEYQSLEALYQAVQSQQISNKLIAGADIGTSNHSTSFVILEEVVMNDGTTLQIERFRRNENGWALDDQKDYFRDILRKGFVKEFHLDATGIGMHMGQMLDKEFGSRVKAWQLGGSTKKLERIFTNLKNRMEGRALALVNDRQTIEDIYLIKRVSTATGGFTYRVDQDQKAHHADRAYAIALASMAGTTWGEDPASYQGIDEDDENLQEFEQRLEDDQTRQGPDRKKLEQKLDEASRAINPSSASEVGAHLDHADPGPYIEDYDL